MKNTFHKVDESNVSVELFPVIVLIYTVVSKIPVIMQMTDSSATKCKVLEETKWATPSGNKLRNLLVELKKGGSLVLQESWQRELSEQHKEQILPPYAGHTAISSDSYSFWQTMQCVKVLPLC